MASAVVVGKAGDLASGQMKAVDVRGSMVLLARVGNNYYAATNRCPHMGGNLSQGKLDGTVVTCPVHGSQFDLKDGHVIKWAPGVPSLLREIGKLVKPPRPLTVYRTKVDGDRITVEI